MVGRGASDHHAGLTPVEGEGKSLRPQSPAGPSQTDREPSSRSCRVPVALPCLVMAQEHLEDAWPAVDTVSTHRPTGRRGEPQPKRIPSPNLSRRDNSSLCQ